MVKMCRTETNNFFLNLNKRVWIEGEERINSVRSDHIIQGSHQHNGKYSGK